MPFFHPLNNINSELNTIEIRRGRNIRINVLESLVPEKGTVFFIHGVGGSSSIWKYQEEFLIIRGYRTVALDLLGHGESPILVRSSCCASGTRWPILASSKSVCICLRCPEIRDLRNSCAFDEHFEDVKAIFEELVVQHYAKRETHERIQHIVTVVAHSYGTSLAVRLAECMGADVVHRLVLISGGAPVPLEHDCSLFDLPAACLAFLTPCIRMGFRRLAFSKQSAVLEIASASDEVDDASLKSVKAMRAELREAFSFNAYSLWATMAGQRWPDGDKHFYSRLEMPTLLICGCQDRLVSEEEEEETLFVLHCGRLRRLPEAGHMGMLEDPNKVNAYILEHINQPPSPRRLSKRVILQSTSSLSSETITTQPIPPKLIGFESQTYNAKCFEQVNSNCKITEGVDPLGLFNLFRPRIHSKRWRESEKFIQIGGNSSYYD